MLVFNQQEKVLMCSSIHLFVLTDKSYLREFGVSRLNASLHERTREAWSRTPTCHERVQNKGFLTDGTIGTFHIFSDTAFMIRAVFYFCF